MQNISSEATKLSVSCPFVKINFCEIEKFASITFLNFIFAKYVKNIYTRNFTRNIYTRIYPSGVIEQCIKTFLNNLYVPKKVYLTAPKKEVFIILPYLGTTSSNLKRKLHSIFAKLIPPCNLKIIFKSTNRLSSFFKFKDILPRELRSHLIYKFSCGSCNATYYGKTERHLNVRSGEHIGKSALTGKRIACKPSAVSDHLLLHDNCNGDFNDFSILCHENNDFKLAIRESILIYRDSPILNKNIASIPLRLFH